MTSNSEGLKQKIASFINRGGSVSFVELEQHIPAFRGDYCYGHQANNILFWPECSLESINAIRELINEGCISMSLTTPLVYMHDGRMTSLPVAKRIMTYKTPRWLPVVFNPVKGKDRER